MRVLPHVPPYQVSPLTMTSQQDPYYYPSTSRIYSESGSGSPVAQQSDQSWAPGATTSDQSSRSQPQPADDPVANLLHVHDVQVCSCHNSGNTATTLPNLQDTNYVLNQPSPDNPLPSTSLQDHGVGAYATPASGNVPFFFPYSPFDYYFPPQYGFAPPEHVYDYSQQPLSHGALQMTGDFPDYIHAAQTSQGHSTPVYPYPMSTQLYTPDRGGATYETETRAQHPVTESFTQDGAIVYTARAELPIDAGYHSHPSPVTTSNQNSASSSTRPLPSSPERKRLLPLSADDEHSEARRVVRRHDQANSTVADSRRRSRSNSVVPGRGPLIPQERYTTSSMSTPEQHPFIPFNLENPEQTGIPITDILNKTGGYVRMKDRTQAFSHMGKKTFTLRIKWPGYRPWSKTLAALDWTKSRAPITRVKLAEAVATGIRDLFEKYRDEPYDPDYAEWNVGPHGIQLDQICVVALHHVSRGSWQPRLCLLTPRR